MHGLIHPNEWNNIPACVRNAIMGLIEFNDKVTKRLTEEDSFIFGKIQKLDDYVCKQKVESGMKFQEVEKKIAREVMQYARQSKRKQEEITKQ